jgi:hypothetical protein
MLVANYFDSSYQDGYAIWLQKPSRRTLTFRMNNNRSVRYFVSLPYTIFSIYYRFNYTERNVWGEIIKENSAPNKYMAVQFFCGFATSGQLRKNTKIYVPPFPNIASNLGVCTGEPRQPCNKNLEILVKKAVNSFWGRNFVHEMYDALEDYYRIFESLEHIEFMEKWQQQTKNNPAWVPDLKFLKKFGNLSEFIGNPFRHKKLH